ncbi:sugar ABC transporter substrate-binding protein [Rhizobium sp. 18055]|uniref:sugar ABC transporter substrate-binding protein n=1 Tax=Rhizobium sp. 18055 TaxID=2681403 RepID=UPI001357B000|nr:sugar ABC transporter substrate-binding protein [Rhizobium sp. 18055]
MNKYIKLALIAGAALVGVATSSFAEERIIMISHGLADDPYWNIVKNGGENAAKQMGVKFDYVAPETFDMVRMSQLITSAVNQKPDGIIVTIPDADALKDAIKSATASGIPVISVNSGVGVAKSFGTLIHIGQDEYPAGKRVGEKLKEMGQKKAICINHEVGNTALDDRCRGVSDGFGGPVAVLPTTNDYQEVKSKVTAALASDPQIDTIVALSAGQAGEPAVDAAQSTGNTKVKVVSFDLSPGFLQDIIDGKAVFAAEAQPYLQSYLGVVFLTNYIRSGLLPANSLIESGPNFITAKEAPKVLELSKKSIR